MKLPSSELISSRYNLFSGEPTTMPLGLTTLEMEKNAITHLSDSSQGVKGVEWGRYHYNAFFGLLYFSFIRYTPIPVSTAGRIQQSLLILSPSQPNSPVISLRNQSMSSIPSSTEQSKISISEPKALNSDMVNDFRETRGATRRGLYGTPMMGRDRYAAELKYGWG